MGLFDEDFSVELSGEHITAQIIHDIKNKRTIQTKTTPKDKWNTVLWRIYEWVKYDQGLTTDCFCYHPWDLGIKEIYDPDTWQVNPLWAECVEYFHGRGFHISYDSLNNQIKIGW